MSKEELLSKVPYSVSTELPIVRPPAGISQWFYGSGFETESWIVPDTALEGQSAPFLLRKRTLCYSYTFPFAPPPPHESLETMPESAYVRAKTTRVPVGGGRPDEWHTSDRRLCEEARAWVETFHRDPPDRYNWYQEGWHYVSYLVYNVVNPRPPIRRYHPRRGEEYTRSVLTGW